MHSTITGTGRYLPAQILTNDELARRIDTSDKWIRSMTGIRHRHIAAPDEEASDMALVASREALSAAGLTASDLDLIVVATITPDMIFPSTAALLQAKLGARHVGAFDLSAACTGFIYGMALADAMVSKAQRDMFSLSAPKRCRVYSIGVTAQRVFSSVMARVPWWYPHRLSQAYAWRACMLTGASRRY